MQPRQISPRKALLLRTSATPAAIHGLMSKPSTGAPKKIRNSCSSSGVPWKIWMKPPRRAQPRDVAGAAERDDEAADRAADEGDQRQRHRPVRRLEDEQEFVRKPKVRIVGPPSAGPGS